MQVADQGTHGRVAGEREEPVFAVCFKLVSGTTWSFSGRPICGTMFAAGSAIYERRDTLVVVKRPLQF